MSGLHSIRKKFNLFVDGRGHAGNGEDFTPPKLALTTEAFRGGSMDAERDIAMGMEKMTASFTLTSFDRHVLSLFGVVQGGNVSLQVREVLEDSNGTLTGVIHFLRGMITELDFGTIKAGDKPALKVAVSLPYYKLVHGSTIVQEIDVDNMIHIVDGVDQLAEQRRLLGL